MKSDQSKKYGRSEKNGKSEELKDNEEKWTIKDFLMVCGIWAATAIIAFLLFTQVFALGHVPSGSMEPTIEIGDAYAGLRYRSGEISRYDIAIFASPEADAPGSEQYIKRVIGLPGETITVTNGKVYAGRELLDDSFTKAEMKSYADGVFAVPENCYFMMGDNRNNSQDARYWSDPAYKKQYIPTEDFRCINPVRVWPFTKIGAFAGASQETEPVLASDEDWGGDHVHDWKVYVHYLPATKSGYLYPTPKAIRCTYCGAEMSMTAGEEAEELLAKEAAHNSKHMWKNIYRSETSADGEKTWTVDRQACVICGTVFEP